MRTVSLVISCRGGPVWSGAVPLAETPFDRTRGLSIAQRLAPGQGMLFHTRPGEVFTMLVMRIPLDLIWIGRGTVIRIDRSAKGLIAAPPGASMLLEVGAGHADYVREGCSLHVVSR